MYANQSTGKKGEALAAVYLQQNGYIILHTNWRHKRSEVDIIALKNNRLHFIEVKTKTSDQFGLPEKQINKIKLKNLSAAAEAFLFQNTEWKEIIFDILCVMITKTKQPTFFLIEDIRPHNLIQ